MTMTLAVNRAAPLKNVAAFGILIERVVERRPDLPGMSCFHGHSGVGKTKSAIYGANEYRAAYVECNQFTTAKSLLISIMREFGTPKPKGTVTDLIEQSIELMAADIRRPLIVDEAHHVADKKFVDVLRTLHDQSLAPVILIGEETLPKKLEAFERVHNRMLDWVAAVPLDQEDFGILALTSCPDVKIGKDLADAILRETRGNTRRVVVNLAKVEEIAKLLDVTELDLAGFTKHGELIVGRAPMPRGRG